MTDATRDTAADADVVKDENLSTEHQKEGDAKRPSDTLDRGQPPARDDGGRKSSLT